jgi:general stress protein YciG
MKDEKNPVKTSDEDKQPNEPGENQAPAEERKDNRSRRGFASMDPEKRKAIASMGGKTAHQKGTAHRFTNEEARDAGQKGGQKISKDRAHMAKIGRKGGSVKAPPPHKEDKTGEA